MLMSLPSKVCLHQLKLLSHHQVRHTHSSLFHFYASYLFLGFIFCVCFFNFQFSLTILLFQSRVSIPAFLGFPHSTNSTISPNSTTIIVICVSAQSMAMLVWVCSPNSAKSVFFFLFTCASYRVFRFYTEMGISHISYYVEILLKYYYKNYEINREVYFNCISVIHTHWGS